MGTIVVENDSIQHSSHLSVLIDIGRPTLANCSIGLAEKNIG